MVGDTDLVAIVLGVLQPLLHDHKCVELLLLRPQCLCTLLNDPVACDQSPLLQTILVTRRNVSFSTIILIADITDASVKHC
jgi:hypothetical protein